MIKYIFDTSSISELNHFYESRFPTLWDKIYELINDGEMVSIKEVKRELSALNKRDFDIENNIKINKPFYIELDEEDYIILKEILSVKGNRELIHMKSINKGTPCADPFLIAKAESSNATLVTEEKYIENAIKIPSICEKRGVNCINLETFMEEQGWFF